MTTKIFLGLFDLWCFFEKFSQFWYSVEREIWVIIIFWKNFPEKIGCCFIDWELSTIWNHVHLSWSTQADWCHLMIKSKKINKKCCFSLIGYFFSTLWNLIQCQALLRLGQSTCMQAIFCALFAHGLCSYFWTLL